MPLRRRDDASAAADASRAGPALLPPPAEGRHHPRPTSRPSQQQDLGSRPACQEAAPRGRALVAASASAARVARRRARALGRRQCFVVASSNPFAKIRAGGGIVEAVNALGPPMRPDAPPRATATVALTRVFEWKRKARVGGLGPGGVSQLVASRRFAAAATGGSPLEGGGALLLWSRAGRRLAPPLSLSAPIVHLATDDDDEERQGGRWRRRTEGARARARRREQQQQQRGWKLLAITADGGVHCWDVRARSLTLRTSLAPLLAVASASAAEAAAAAAAAAATSTTAADAAAAAVAPAPSSSSFATPVGLVSARLCRATGAPTVVLSDFSAAVFDMGLGWVG